MMEPDVRCPASPALLSQDFGAYIASASAAAVAARGSFVIALSGGSLPQAVAIALAAAASAGAAVPPIAFDRWLVVYADERIVPLDHADSNHRACVTALSDMPLLPSQFIAIDPLLAPAECARDYESRLRAALHCNDASLTPQLDLVLLGMGPDGHTASLFPGASFIDRALGGCCLLRERRLGAPLQATRSFTSSTCWSRPLKTPRSPRRSESRSRSVPSTMRGR